MFTASELDERIDKCQKILETDPNSQIFAALANSHRKKGNLEKAFLVCQNGLRIHPSYGSAHVVMAKINLDRGLYDWAEIEANKASDIDGHTRSIELLLAEIYIYKGQFNSAIKLLMQLHEREPDHPQIKKLLEIARRLPEEQAAMTGSVRPGDQSTDEKSELRPESVPQKPSTPLTTTEVLKKSIAIPGVDGVLFVNPEGLVVESEWTLKMNPTTCAAMMGEIEKVVNGELVKSCFGRVRTVLMETEEPMFYLIRTADGVFLFATNSSANLGTLRMRLEKLLAKYQP